MKDFGIRNKDTGEITARFDDPIEAASHIKDPEHEEVAERQLENIVERFPDNKVYITGMQETWTAYKI